MSPRSRAELYHFVFTWSDGETFETDSTDSWTAQNQAHWQRYGQHGTPESERATLESMEITDAGRA